MSCADGTNGGGIRTPPPFHFRKLVQRIREEFDDFPGLRVSVCEAARFWCLDFATSQQVLSELLAAGFLTRDSDQRYVLVT